ESEEVDLNDKIKKVLEDLELDIRQTNAVVHIDNLPVIKGHRRQLQQLFQNLISNAIKYRKTNTNPELFISSKKVPWSDTPVFLENTDLTTEFYAISVADNGIGFEQQHSEKIFKMFQRLHGKSEYSGTGVGLSIAKKVAENHGGAIIAESTVGVGSRFTFYLPVE
ncbi:MAG: PAS domain-containing sensor histidine kinase, partial [Chitinophagaceae bacterium]|nr:PAS domain-containing sensor histidine kinase [Chitinophagaceae bacterium]